MRKLFYALLLVIIFSCSACMEINTSSQFTTIANYVNAKAARKIEKEIPNLRLIGLGGSMIDGVIKHEKLVFNHKGKLDEDQGALLLTRVVEMYLKTIYSEPKMAEYLKEHPFTYKNLHIVFIIYDNKGEPASYPDLGNINLDEGYILYRTIKRFENNLRETITVKKELYEEAAKRVGAWK